MRTLQGALPALGGEGIKVIAHEASISRQLTIKYNAFSHMGSPL